MTADRDPVADMIRYAEANGARWALASRRPVSRVRWFVAGVLAGILATLWWAGVAQAQVPPVAEQHRRDLTRISQSVWGLDAPVSLLAAQIQQESGWRPDAKSRVGAAGLTQFMPATARDVAARYELGPPNVLDPRWAMQAQSNYMRELHRVIAAANESERFAFALASYNGGLGHVRTRQSMSDDPRRCLNATCDIRPPRVSEANQHENREYPRRIMLVLMPRYHAAGWGGPALHARYGV
jgi:soluble lytic murein transglycosylase-like protein